MPDKKNIPRKGANKRRALLSLLSAFFILLLLAACSTNKPAVQEQNDYLLVKSEQEVSYLTDDHPDVQEVTRLVERLIAVLENQDYRDPDLNGLKSLGAESFTNNLIERTQDELATHEITKELRDWQIQSIVFAGNQLQRNMAYVTVELKTLYTAAGPRYREREKIVLNEVTERSATVFLNFNSEVRVPQNPLFPINKNYGWSITHISYHVKA